jgi:hypothetical protein
MVIKFLRAILFLVGVVPFRAFTYDGWKPQVPRGMQSIKSLMQTLQYEEFFIITLEY